MQHGDALKHLHHQAVEAAAPLADQLGGNVQSGGEVEMLVNRTIGNQFTCAVRARSNTGVNIYSFA